MSKLHSEIRIPNITFIRVAPRYKADNAAILCKFLVIHAVAKWANFIMPLGTLRLDIPILFRDHFTVSGAILSIINLKTGPITFHIWRGIVITSHQILTGTDW